jgi:hypothetical protein
MVFDVPKKDFKISFYVVLENLDVVTSFGSSNIHMGSMDGIIGKNHVIAKNLIADKFLNGI